MANQGKNKKSAPTPRKRLAGRKVARMALTRTRLPIDGSVVNHWRMLSDPCFAPLSTSAYRGQAGIVSRFTSITTVSTGSDTGFLMAASPQAGAYTLAQFTDPTIPTAAFAYANPLPGQAFITNNAEAVRVVGFCVDVDYIGTELNRSGMIYGGVVLGDTIGQGASPTPDSIKQLLPNQVRTPDRQITQLWFPGVGNEAYGNNGAGSVAFAGGFNSLIIMAEGMPAGIQVRLRITTILEWLPLLGVGVSMPSPVAGYNAVGAYEKLHDIAAASNMFTHSFISGVYERANAMAYRGGQALMGLAAAGMTSAVGRAMTRNPNYGNLQILN